MSAPPHIRPSKDKGAADVLVELLKPHAWIPPAHGARWLPVIEALLEAFLRHFRPRGANGGPPYSCGWLKIAWRLVSSPDPFRSRPGGSASRCGRRATPRNRLRRGGGESAGCARLLQIQPPRPRPCNHR